MSTFTMLDVGRGDCAVILENTKDGQRCIVIDAGDAYPAGSQSLIGYLQEQGVDTIDLAILTHMHPDHFGGFSRLPGKVKVRTLITPCADELAFTPRELELYPHKKVFEQYSVFYADCVKQGTEMITGNACFGKTYGFGDVELVCVSPEAGAELPSIEHLLQLTKPQDDEALHAHTYSFDWGCNDDSTVWVVRVKGEEIALITGDAPLKVLEKTQAEKRVHPRMVKVSHHGAPDYCSDAWLASLQPQTVLVTNNRDGWEAPHCQGFADRCGAKLHFVSDGPFVIAWE